MGEKQREVERTNSKAAHLHHHSLIASENKFPRIQNLKYEFHALCLLRYKAGLRWEVVGCDGGRARNILRSIKIQP
jgi:hypothetical protein